VNAPPWMKLSGCCAAQMIGRDRFDGAILVSADGDQCVGPAHDTGKTHIARGQPSFLGAFPGNQTSIWHPAV
jgi:hypothetical protein